MRQVKTGAETSPSGETCQDSLVGAWPLGQRASCEVRMPPWCTGQELRLALLLLCVDLSFCMLTFSQEGKL